jgi:hypothetical protein
MSEENVGGRPGCEECVCGGAGPALTALLKQMGPSEAAKSHFTQARVEFLKGLRSMIDARIDSLSKEESKGTKVTVE